MNISPIFVTFDVKFSGNSIDSKIMQPLNIPFVDVRISVLIFVRFTYINL